MDTHTATQRSYNMSRIKSKNTKIEILFRKLVWRRNLKGYRVKTNIPGKPDLYFPKKKFAVFIDGCFWHKCPIDFIRPRSKNSYWDKKIKNNILRDNQINKELKKKGIRVIRFWEHEVEKDLEKCYSILRSAYEKIDNI